MGKTDFTYELRGAFVLVVERGGAVSVTNDAEGVIRELVADGLDLAGRAVIYRDDCGLWDALLTQGNRFARFRILNARTPEEAMQRLALPERDGIAPPILPR
jgi:hypothetical protein